MKVCGLSWMEPCVPPKSRTLGLRLAQPVPRGVGEEGAPGGLPPVDSGQRRQLRSPAGVASAAS